MTTAAPAKRKALSRIKDDIVYYEHQLRGVRQMARMNNFILADEMGLGKTLQSLTVAAIDFDRHIAKRVLIVTPASLKWNWAEDMDKFTEFAYHVLDGTPTQRANQLRDFAWGDKDVLVINYRQVEPHLDELNDMDFDILICDEAHYIKGHKSDRTKAVHKLKVKRVMLLTGTPLLNNVTELWGLLKRLEPDRWGGYYSFQHRFALMGGFKNKAIIGVKNEAEIQGHLDRLMIRRLKKDWLDIPDKQFITLEVDLHPEQAAMYKQAVEEMIITLEDEDDLIIENPLVKFLRLKQIAGTTACITPERDRSLKLDLMIERAVELIDNGEHIVIFTQFREVQSALVRRLDGHPTYVLNGDVPIRDRVSEVNKWAADKPGAMVAMLQVAGVGLNMTKASTCLFADKLFTPGLNDQAVDRLHRIGADLTKPVQVIEFIVRGTVEHRVEEILRTKKEVFDLLVTTPAEWKRELFAALKEDFTSDS